MAVNYIKASTVIKSLQTIEIFKVQYHLKIWIPNLLLEMLYFSSKFWCRATRDGQVVIPWGSTRFCSLCRLRGEVRNPLIFQLHQRFEMRYFLVKTVYNLVLLLRFLFESDENVTRNSFVRYLFRVQHWSNDFFLNDNESLISSDNLNFHPRGSVFLRNSLRTSFSTVLELGVQRIPLSIAIF